MELDTDLLASLAWRAVHLERARDEEAPSARRMFQDAATPLNVIELLRELQHLRDMLAAFGRSIAPGNAASNALANCPVAAMNAAREQAEALRQEIETLRLANRALNERTLAPDYEPAFESEANPPSADGVDWKLVPHSFVEDALCAVDLIFELRQTLCGPGRPERALPLSAIDAANSVDAYARQLEADGYRWTPCSSGYPAHPLLELEPPARLVDQEILMDAQRWRDQLWHELEIIDVRRDPNGHVSGLMVCNRRTGATVRLAPCPPSQA